MVDNATTSSPAAVQAAVAELNHEVGVAVGMDYGCDASGAYTYDMVGVYIAIYYITIPPVSYTNRQCYTASDWFDLIKWNINANRPIHYRIPGHSIVCDGWQEIGSPVTNAISYELWMGKRRHHMVYRLMPFWEEILQKNIW